MVSVWRNPLLACGLGLLCLGAGNWWVGWSKMEEYSQRITDAETEPEAAPLVEFPELTPGTDATLLARLRRGLDTYTVSDAKLDFYRVVDSGGRLLAVAGLLLMCVALTHHHFFKRAERSPGALPRPVSPRDAGR